MSEVKRLFFDGILSPYEDLLDSMNWTRLDKKKLRSIYTNLFNEINNILEYIAIEHPDSIMNSFNLQTSRNLSKDFREVLTTGTFKNHPFAYIRDIANVSKHLKISRPDRLIDDVSQLKEAIYFITYEESGQYYGSYKFGLILQKNNDEYNHCEFIAFYAIKYIKSILADLELIDRAKFHELNPPNYYVSKSDALKRGAPTVLALDESSEVACMKAYLYDLDSPMKIRLPTDDEPFKITASVKIEVVKIPYKKYSKNK